METHVFLIMVTANSLAKLQRSLPEIVPQLSAGRSLVVVDDGSTDGTIDLIKATFPSVFLIANKANLGYVKSVNVGIQFAIANRATHVLVVSPGSIMPANVVELLLKKPVDIVAPIYRHRFDNQEWYEIGGVLSKLLKKPKLLLVRLRPPASFNTTPQFVSFRCVLLPVKTLAKLGMLSEAYHHYFADVDYCLRAKRAGLKIGMQPLCIVDTLSGSTKKTKQMQRFFARDVAALLKSSTGGIGRVIATMLYQWLRLSWSMSMSQLQASTFDPV